MIRPLLLSFFTIICLILILNSRKAWPTEDRKPTEAETLYSLIVLCIMWWMIYMAFSIKV